MVSSVHSMIRMYVRGALDVPSMPPSSALLESFFSKQTLLNDTLVSPAVVGALVVAVDTVAD
jgi:hypothetical protein